MLKRFLIFVLLSANILFADGEFGDIPLSTPIAPEETVCRNAADNAWISCAVSAGGGAVDSVNGQTGVVVLDADDIDDSATTHKFTDAAGLAIIAATSGTNTGDQDLSDYFDTTVDDTDDITEGVTNLFFTSAEQTKLAGIEAGAEINTVDSVNGQTGVVVLDADDIDDSATTHKFTDAADIAKLAGIEAGATANSTDAFLLDRTNHTGTQAASTISDFDTEVSNNASVTANTAKVTESTTVSDTAEIDLTQTGTDIEADIIAGSVALSKLSNGANVAARSFGIVLDGGGAEITTGLKGFIEIPFDCTISQVTMLADQSFGTLIVDIWKDTYANYPPTDADSITNLTPPTLVTDKYQDSTLSGWTTSVSAGDIIGFNVDSANTVEKVTVNLICDLA